MLSSIEMLQKVAHALGPLVTDVVFVGGTIPALLITDPAAPSVRPTKDVDLIVDSRNLTQHAAFEAKLRHRGFQIQSPPISRYGFEDVLVDVMSTTPGVMGFSDRWYAEAFAQAEPFELPDKTTIRVIQGPLFLATKLSAWQDRGNQDLYHHDLEDIFAVIDGRPSLLDEVRRSEPDLRRYLAEALAELAANPGFRGLVAAHLGGGAIAYERADMATDIVYKIIAVGQG